jgi:predicted nucleic acid-binding protein
MSARVFLDTNILLYIYSESEPIKSAICQTAINNNNCYTSTQALNELSNVCLRKWNMNRSNIENAIDEISSACQVTHITENTIKKALFLHEKYKYSYYDCLMLAAAIESNCEMIFSEDMQNGQIVENTLTIKNILINI